LPDLLAESHEAVILDACCLITLSCTGRIEEILRCLPTPVMVADYVYSQEVLKFDLSKLLSTGLLATAKADTEAEQIMVVAFALDLDDGEAMTGALAAHSNWAIATDDKKALAIFNKALPNIQLISTLSMIKYWAETTGASDDEIRVALEDLHRFAPYEPKSSHPLYHWWRRYIQT
jgi:predicted nucleic acid-binding protein